VPVRFRVDTSRRNAQADLAARLEVQALNISERGGYFSSREPLWVGEVPEPYFTPPRGLTGLQPQQVRCPAREVHVDGEPTS
jgi:hypothetical protein